MFADEKSAKCQRFISRVPSRGALAVNAFSDPRWWRAPSLLWCVPPPALICQTLGWMRRERAKGVLGMPYWTSHPAFPSLFPPSHTPLFVKDFIMYPEGNAIIIPGTGAKAVSTLRSYKGSISNLRAYARERGLDTACPTSLVIYSLKKIQEGRSLSTLKTLSAAFCHYSDPLSPAFAHILSYLHDSTRRIFVVAHHSSVPRSHMDSLVHYASSHHSDLLSTRSALGASLSFSALLRVSWSSDLLKISVKRAKNDQFGEGRDTFVSLEKDSRIL
ncbi:hypothetical protein PENTCL1PPCAC_1286, partial [Pristionchus entomophagus]